MRALVVTEPNDVLLHDVDPPPCGPDDVLIGSRVAAICGTDLKIVHGALPPGVVAYPCIPGHEWSGIVERVGRGVRDLEPGSRVVSEGMLRCERCSRCLAGETNLCENYAQLGFTRAGGFGELVASPRRLVHHLPDGVSLDAAALVEPLACIVRAFRRGRVASGETVGIFGIGGLGSIGILLARRLGAGAVAAYTGRAVEAALAQRLGADITFEVSTTELSAVTLDGGGLDVVVETSGAPAAARAAMRVLRRGGRLVLVGTAGQGTALPFDDDMLVRRELEVTGSLSYSAADWAEAFRLVVGREIDLDKVITHRFPIEEFEAAFALFRERSEPVGRIVLDHSDRDLVRRAGGARP